MLKTVCVTVDRIGAMPHVRGKQHQTAGPRLNEVLRAQTGSRIAWLAEFQPSGSQGRILHFLRYLDVVGRAHDAFGMDVIDVIAVALQPYRPGSGELRRPVPDSCQRMIVGQIQRTAVLVHWRAKRLQCGLHHWIGVEQQAPHGLRPIPDALVQRLAIRAVRHLEGFGECKIECADGAKSGRRLDIECANEAG